MSASVLHTAYPRNAAKQIARDFNVALVTAKHWLRFGFPRGREAQVQPIVERRLEEQAAEIADTLNFIRGIANEAGSARARLGTRTHGVGAQQAGAMARGEGSG